MEILITDTNVLIDLINCGASDGFMRLSYKIKTLDLVIAEITEVSQRNHIQDHIDAGRLDVLILSGEEVAKAAALPTIRSLRLRITDKAVLLKAIDLACCLLTGDRDLRLEAAGRGIEVHGSIWALREIAKAGGVSKEQLLQMVESLETSNLRLPPSEIEKLKQDIKNAT